MKKKWFWIIVFLAVIAVVLSIVFINLFRDKDTRDLSEKVNSVVTTGYLAEDSEEYEIINEYFDLIYGKLGTSEEKSEVKNFQNTYKAYVVAGKFFNREMIFGEFTDAYKNNRKKVETKFDKAQSSAESLKGYINTNKTLVSGSAFWEANTWSSCKDLAKEMFTQTIGAFDLLQDIYQSSITSKIARNDLTEIIFKQMTAYSSKTTENLTTDETCGATLYSFVNMYLSENGRQLILNFEFNTYNNIQAKVADIKENGENSRYYQDFLNGNL